MTKGKRRVQRILLALAVGLAGALVPASEALAGDGPWYASKSSSCTTAISGKTGGGRGTAYINYDARRASLSKYIIEWADNWAGNFWVCSGDYQVAPYQITVTQEFRFDGSSLSCTGGFYLSYPPGISYECTKTGQTVVIELTTTCALYRSTCRIDRGYTEVLANAGGRFNDYVNARTVVLVRNSSGGIHIWSTPYR